MHSRAVALFLLFAAGAPRIDARLRAGAAQVKITPPRGAPMAGYYSNRNATGVHDDLYAKAIVLDDGETTAALVACDIIGMPRPVVDSARRLIEAKTGIPAGHVAISATHAHTGPVLETGASRYNLTGAALDLARRYADGLPALIAEAVGRAQAALKPARISGGTGREDTLAFNRRFYMADGTVGWNPGKLNPKIVRPAGPIDPDVGVVFFEDDSGAALAGYVNYALHLDTVGGLEISADYPYTLSRILGALKGPEFITLFSIGCAGNVNHIDVSTKAPQKGHGEAERIGTVLAGEVIKTMTRLSPAEGRLQVAAAAVLLPRPSIAPGELEKARAVAAGFGKPDAAPFIELVKASKVIEVAESGGKPLEAEVQAIAVGKDIAWVALPGEIFVELGMEIKRRSPFRQTIVAELANGSPGYIPNRKAYAEGAYEVVSARVAEGSGEFLVEAAVKLLGRLYAGK
jgi:hypothetical protein